VRENSKYLFSRRNLNLSQNDDRDHSSIHSLCGLYKNVGAVRDSVVVRQVTNLCVSVFSGDEFEASTFRQRSISSAVPCAALALRRRKVLDPILILSLFAMALLGRLYVTV
jgi:hypothetical protein